MHGNAPHQVADGVELTPEQRRHLRRDGVAVAARARELLPDGFAVGSELVDGPDGVLATVAVRSPGGGVVSAGFSLDDADDPADLARQLAAGAALEAKHAQNGHHLAAR